MECAGNHDAVRTDAYVVPGAGGQIVSGVEVVSRLPDNSVRRSTYADLHRRARALAASLQQAGLRQGDRVATLMWNHSTHLEAYFGIPAVGGVVHTLNLRLHPDELAFIANHAQDRWLIVDDVLLPIYEKFADKVRFERVFVVPFCGSPTPSQIRRLRVVPGARLWQLPLIGGS